MICQVLHIFNALSLALSMKRQEDLDLAEHDLVPPVVELHGVVVPHGVVAAEVDTLLAILNEVNISNCCCVTSVFNENSFKNLYVVNFLKCSPSLQV